MGERARLYADQEQAAELACTDLTTDYRSISPEDGWYLNSRWALSSPISRKHGTMQHQSQVGSAI